MYELKCCLLCLCCLCSPFQINSSLWSEAKSITNLFSLTKWSSSWRCFILWDFRQNCVDGGIWDCTGYVVYFQKALPRVTVCLCFYSRKSFCTALGLLPGCSPLPTEGGGCVSWSVLSIQISGSVPEPTPAHFYFPMLPAKVFSFHGHLVLCFAVTPALSVLSSVH